jgi:DNA gyrase subunit A
LPVMGRTAQGLQALRLRSQEKLVGCVTVDAKDHLLLVSQLGYAKRLPVSTLRQGILGEIGTQMLQFTSKADSLAGMVAATESSEVVLVTTQRVVRVAVNSVKVWGKDGAGDRIVQLNPEEKILNLVMGNG